MKKLKSELIKGKLYPLFFKILITMKLSFIMLLCSALSVLASNSYSQTKKLNLELKSVSVGKALESIENQSEFYFLYSRKLVDVDRLVSINVKDQNIEAALKQIFSGTDVNYVIKDRVIVLTIPGIADNNIYFKLQQKITGTISDATTGEPIIGANIIVEGTTIGIVSDASGKFILDIPGPDVNLVISFLGYQTQRIQVKGLTSLNIKLIPDVQNLEEIVVVGYGSSKRSDITGSISTIKNDKLTVAPVASVSNTLAGRVPGLQSIQKTGEPGNDASKLSIRGFGNALIIVDGVEQQDFNNLASNEIETVSVLKDASAAIYGARAGNGVILVTTKRGKLGKPVITVNSSYSVSGNINYPKILTAGQYTELYREAQINSGVNPANTKYKESDVRNYYAQNSPDSISTDWWKATMKDWAPMQQHDISLQGGNDVVRYYGYAGYTRQDGMFKTGDNTFNRFNVRSNIDANVTKNFSIEFNLSAIVGDLSRSAQGIQEAGQFWNTFFWAKPTHPAYLPDKSKVAYSGGPLSLNPVINTSKDIGGYNQVKNQNIKGSMGLKYNIPFINGLSVKAFGDYQTVTTNEKTFSKFVQTYTYNFAKNEYTKGSATSSPTSLNESFAQMYIFTGQFSLNYSRNFNDKHDINGLLLYELIDSYNKNIAAYRRDFLSTEIDYLFAGSTSTQQNGGSANEFGRSSVIGRLNYKFNKKYLSELTLRYDGSPNFPKDTRWGLFPSVSLGWIVSEESFVKDNVNWISSLKLRGSLSNTGYDNVGPFQYIAGYNLGARAFALNGAQQMGISSTGVPNPEITWEEMTTYNGGLDFSFFRSSVYGEFDVFYRLREGILGTRIMSLPSTFGASLPAENINSVDTRGFELLLGYRKTFGDLGFDISGNVSWARSKWVHFDEPDYTNEDDIKINKKTGKWTDVVYGYATDKLFTSQEEIKALTYDIDGKGNSTIKPGDIKYLNLNGDNKLDWRDYKVIAKSGLPTTMFGMNMSMNYKNFDFSALFQGAAGRSMPVMQGMQSEQATTQNVFKYRWTEANPDVNALFPRQSFSTNNSKISEFWYKDASYLRLKVVSFGYNVPKSVINRIGIASARVYISGTNLFTISGLTKYNIDPETPGESMLGFGYTGAVYPHQRTVNAGMNLSF